jgi:hypothetical protein
MMLNERQQRRLLDRLSATLPDMQLVITQRPGDVVCAHPADRSDIEIVCADGTYDAWRRPKGPRHEDVFRAGRAIVINEPALRPVKFSMTLTEATAWLRRAMGETAP